MLPEVNMPRTSCDRENFFSLITSGLHLLLSPAVASVRLKVAQTCLRDRHGLILSFIDQLEGVYVPALLFRSSTIIDESM